MSEVAYITLKDGTKLDIQDVKTQELLSYRAEHNAHFRHKKLGTIASVAQCNEFMADYGINLETLGDVFPGDYFTVQDGTYNVDWMFAGFDTELNKGDTAFTSLHGSIIPVTKVTDAKMNSSNTTGTSENESNESGLQAYAGSDMRVITLPAVATALRTVLGDHLKSRRVLLSKTMTAATVSMAGAGFNGASTAWEWYSEYLTLMTEIQVYGSTVYSSSFYDIGEGCEKLPVFNFINPVQYARINQWLRVVASSTGFAHVHGNGVAAYGTAGNSHAVRPLGVLA